MKYNSTFESFILWMIENLLNLTFLVSNGHLRWADKSELLTKIGSNDGLNKSKKTSSI